MTEKEWRELKENCPFRYGNGWEGYVCKGKSNSIHQRSDQAGCYRMKDCAFAYWVKVINVCGGKG
jgi:hypothetical protein